MTTEIKEYRQESKVKTYLETITNIAVIVVSILVLSLFAWYYLTPQKPKPLLQNGLQKGKLFVQVPGIDYSKSCQTLLLVTSSTCVYCEESLPFYKQLAETEAQRNSRTHFWIIFPETEAAVRQYKEKTQVNVNSLSGLDLRALNIEVTPTLILVDSNGIILDFWIGKLLPESEQQVRRAIGAPQI